MTKGETRSERMSYTLEPTLAKKVRAAEDNVSDYIWTLIVRDMKARGLVSDQELADIFYGKPEGDA